jgi:V8-like Glu-specific endopeptidase
MIKQFVLLPTVIFVSFNFVPYNSPSQNVSFKFFSSNESTLNLSGNNISLSTISNQSGDNMVDYNFETGEIGFEPFNPDSYQKRTSDSINEAIRNSTSSNSTSNDKVILENKQDYTITIGDNNFNAIRGFFPAETASILSPKGIGGVYGEDDRTRVINPDSFPYFPVGLLKINHENSDPSFGTAFVAGPNLLITNAHCTFGLDDNHFDTPAFAYSLEFFPGLNGASELEGYSLKCNALSAHIPTNYYLFDPNVRSMFDWAIIEIDRDIGYQTGWYGSIENWFESNFNVFSYGYPLDKNKQMWQTSGRSLDIANNGYYVSTTLDICGGQSGSPALINLNDNEKFMFGVCSGSTFYTDSYETICTNVTRWSTLAFHYLRSFFDCHNVFVKKGTILPTDYGFADEYPTSSNISNVFRSHIINNDFSFQTRRYRTGYIHNEYVVMSPIRRNIHEAFIEYSFSEPISKIDIQLSFWRGSSMEWLTKDNGSAELSARRSIGGLEVWTQSLDLLSDETALPTDRAYPNTYSVSFGIPVYGFRLSAETHEDYYNDSNRGRICIGDIDVYEYVF